MILTDDNCPQYNFLFRFHNGIEPSPDYKIGDGVFGEAQKVIAAQIKSIGGELSSVAYLRSGLNTKGEDEDGFFGAGYFHPNLTSEQHQACVACARNVAVEMLKLKLIP